jgi:membrane protein YdbS with pleckstrin-like domain
MTQAEFRKSGWVKAFAQFDETELATIILCIRSIVEIGVWPELVRYCVHRITETMDETLLENMESDVLH